MNATETPCKMSMFWNWDTVDSCFITEQWHVQTTRQYAGTLIGVFLLVVVLEAFRRMSRAYDGFILRRYKDRVGQSNKEFRPSLFQHLLRSLFYLVQFSAAYLLMLAAMTHNGGLILAIFSGAFAGFLFFGRDTVPGSTALSVESSEYPIQLEQLGAKKGGARV
ncbi:Ctr copper transporter family-domain-containing protein [Roridomyces roridus]|uniref:Copper transport protein n=1 Tax=Roridomyces roridus TaxID=1738132 RepID=A0AAD7BH72_9AGAR|nr:Ctr copper transporter family-domain-containing protein [Roridomyces roridus]